MRSVVLGLTMVAMLDLVPIVRGELALRVSGQSPSRTDSGSTLRHYAVELSGGDQLRGLEVWVRHPLDAATRVVVTPFGYESIRLFQPKPLLATNEDVFAMVFSPVVREAQRGAVTRVAEIDVSGGDLGTIPAMRAHGTTPDGQDITVPVVLETQGSLLISPRPGIDVSPNPTQGAVAIHFRTGPMLGHEVAISDLLGRPVAVLRNASCDGVGCSTSWNVKDASGIPVPSGMYFVRVGSGRSVICQPLTVIR